MEFLKILWKSIEVILVLLLLLFYGSFMVGDVRKFIINKELKEGDCQIINNQVFCKH